MDECADATTRPVRVHIVDASAPFRRAARNLLELCGYRVVGYADCMASGLIAAGRLKPDAVLLDVRLRDGSGLDLCELLTCAEDAPAVLLVSIDGAADDVRPEAHGARGLVPKQDLGRVNLGSIWA